MLEKKNKLLTNDSGTEPWVLCKNLQVTVPRILNIKPERERIVKGTVSQKKVYYY